MNYAAFTTIDRSLFERLHWGPLEPITFRLKDGRSVTGDLVAVSRIGLSDGDGSTAAGEIVIATAGGRTVLTYDQIESVA